MPTMNDSSQNSLVSPLWLKKHINDDNLVVVDCVYDHNAYTRAHIPGAIMRLGSPYIKSVDKNSELKLHLPTAREFDKLMEDMKISADKTLVCYDEWGSYWSTRFWWIASHYGHSKVKVLNGGWQGWLSAGLPISNKTNTLKNHNGRFCSVPQKNSIVSKDELLDNYESPDWVVIDVRSDGEYLGSEPEENKRHGHIPGAIHIEWKRLVTNSYDMEGLRAFLPREKLLSILTKNGIISEKTVVTYCQSGVRASHTAFILKVLGFPDVRVYDGSMKEWANLNETPLTK